MGKLSCLSSYSFFIPYATFLSGDYDFLNPKKEDVVIDAGANIEDFTVSIAGKVSEVIAIEPSRENLFYLRLNAGNTQNITIIQKAIGNERGILGLTGQGVSAAMKKMPIIVWKLTRWIAYARI